MDHVRSRLIGFVVVSVLLASGPADARSHQRSRHNPEPAKATSFDYYVLSLSWSPEHCSEKPGGPDDTQCGTSRHFGFVVHGLWPQYENGGYPQSCATSNKLTNDVIDATLDIMPSKDLITHEWQKHGTCSGSSADVYFQHARQAFEAVTVPERYKTPLEAFRVTAADVRSDFRAANPSLADDGIAVLCNGHFFTELRLCLSKDSLAPRTCGAKVKDNCNGRVTVRPLR